VQLNYRRLFLEWWKTIAYCKDEIQGLNNESLVNYQFVINSDKSMTYSAIFVCVCVCVCVCVWASV